MNARKLLNFSSVLLFILALWFMHRELAQVSLAAVNEQLRETSFVRVAAAVAFAAGGYIVMIFYDVLALRYVGKAVPLPRLAMTSFMAFAVGNNVGIATLSAGPIRYRMYGALGLAGVDIARVVFFCTLTLVVGIATLLGSAFWFIPSRILGDFDIASLPARIAGTIMLTAVVGYLLLPVFRRTPVRLLNWQIEIPSLGITLSQLVIAALDLALAAATLYVLVAPELNTSFLAFLGVYLIAIAAGMLSNVPGGIGVFEAIILLAFPDAGRDVLLGKIIVYRLIYYAGPLMLALVIMVAHEVVQHRSPLRAAGGRVATVLSSIVPQVVGVSVFLSGLVLLVSGATPAITSRLEMIGELLPHALLELSHLAGSVIGLGLLVLSRGLFRRLHGAYRIVSLLLLTGAVTSMVKGFDYEEAAILVAVYGLLWIARGEFRRQGSLLHQSFPIRWVVTILIALAGTVWIGMASYREIPYSHELWWQFSLDGDAPRMLRAMLLVSVGAIAFSIARLIRPAPPRVHVADGDEIASVRQIVAQSDQIMANAALMGDKRFLFNDARTAFIMYQVSGRSWIALGDPVGPKSEHEALAWRFRELCDRFDGSPAFYQISDASLPFYIDMGLTLSKLGEEGLVPLENFSLEGKTRADFRQARHRAERAGASFSIVPASEVPPLISEFETVSRAWLQQKSAAEKGFSLGRFSPEYVTQFDCAVIRQAGRVVAFANLWPARAGRELSIDLMRYDEHAQKSVMDYLFPELMLWGRSQGFAWFNLGMAPLSGLETHPLAPLWHRVGGLIFRHAENFYNFEGLRQYKEKFEPVWRPHYLASRGGLAVARTLIDVSALISGGLVRTVLHRGD